MAAAVKRASRPEASWAAVRNQLSMDTGLRAGIMEYEKY